MAKIVLLYCILCVTIAVGKSEKRHESWSNLNKLIRFHLDVGIESNSLQHDIITELQKSRSCEPLCQYNSQVETERNLPENINLPKSGKINKNIEAKNEKKLRKEIAPSKPYAQNAGQKKQSHKVTRSEIQFQQILEHGIVNTDYHDKVGCKQYDQRRKNPENQTETPISDSEHEVVSRKVTPNLHAQSLKTTNKPSETQRDHENEKAKENPHSKLVNETKIRYEPPILNYERGVIYFNVTSTQLENDLEMEPEVKLDSLESHYDRQTNVTTDVGLNVIPPRPSFPTAPSMTNNMNVTNPVIVVGPSIQTNQTAPKPVVPPSRVNVTPPRARPKPRPSFPTAPSMTNNMNVTNPVIVVGPSIQTNQTAQKPVVPPGRVNVTSPRPSFPTAPSMTNNMNVTNPGSVVGSSIQTNQTAQKPVVPPGRVNVTPPWPRPKPRPSFPTAPSMTNNMNVTNPGSVVGSSIQTNQTAQKPVVPPGRVNVTPPRPRPKPRPSFPTAPSMTNNMNITNPVIVVGPSIQTNQTVVPPGSKPEWFPIDRDHINKNESDPRIAGNDKPRLPNVFPVGIEGNETYRRIVGLDVSGLKARLDVAKNSSYSLQINGSEKVTPDVSIIRKEKRKNSEHNNRTYPDTEIIKNDHNRVLNNSYSIGKKSQNLFGNNDTKYEQLGLGHSHVTKNGLNSGNNNSEVISYVLKERLDNYKPYLAVGNNTLTNKVSDSLQNPKRLNYQSHFNISDDVNKNLTHKNGPEIANINYDEDLKDIADVRALTFGESLNPKNQYQVKLAKFKFSGDEHGFESSKVNANVSPANKAHSNSFNSGEHSLYGENLGLRT